MNDKDGNFMPYFKWSSYEHKPFPIEELRRKRWRIRMENQENFPCPNCGGQDWSASFTTLEHDENATCLDCGYEFLVEREIVKADTRTTIYVLTGVFIVGVVIGLLLGYVAWVYYGTTFDPCPIR